MLLFGLNIRNNDLTIALVFHGILNNYSSSPNGSWAIDSEAMRARGIIVLVKSN